MDKEILTNFGFILAGIIAGIVAYYTKKPTSQPTVTTDAVVAGVGIELGNRHQTEMIIEQLTRIGDILEDKRQRGLEEHLEEILERLPPRDHPPRPVRRRRRADEI